MSYTTDPPSSGDPPAVFKDPNDPFSRFHPLRVNPKLFKRPDPITLYLGFGGQSVWNSLVTINVIRTLEQHQRIAHRPLTQPEADATIEHCTARLYHSRIGQPVGVLVGAIACYKASQRTDIWKKNFAPEAGIRRYDLLIAGIQKWARENPTTWRKDAARAGMQTAFVAFVCLLIGDGIAGARDINDMMMDSRLKGLWAEARRRRGEMRGLGEEQSQLPQQQQQQQGDGLGVQTGSDEEAARFGSSTTSWGTETKKVATPSYETPKPSRDNADDFWDDASPVAAEYRDKDQSVPGESAWERIRKQNNVSAQREVRTVYKPASSSTASAPAPAPANDKPSERELAQAEFDRMLEAERKMSTDSLNTPQQHTSGWWGKWD
ncbi:hypothetical protein BO83DRAFT_410701 [Aspergillus eucalypticola CBS 122712]|uniref:Endo-1,3(4)-beta-glucanase n=1 Tax=Aspergillus eucalypticola (strain CBS 122712 / IBT 29274) TaxID=1448314 RepID=A0A317UWC3_ASPEC|nr:uncharacterized protein BO83DRAFT_410701 [Aspergillus eucalypticola CBS 122712]PWY65766.1 hypothetical protein BO83DRAFT_410701 [Aspergillus eucalypticola CBS 122712]